MTTLTAFRQALAPSSLRRNVSIILGISSMTTPMVALCEEKSFMDKIVARDRSGNIDWYASMDQVSAEAGKSVQGAIDSGYPTQLSYGFVMGYCSGYALKKAGKVAAVILGESLSYCLRARNRTKDLHSGDRNGWARCSPMIEKCILCDIGACSCIYLSFCSLSLRHWFCGTSKLTVLRIHYC